MCARFTLKSSSDVVGGLFDLDELPDLKPRTNIAPTQEVLSIINVDGKREATTFRWGLIPSWARDASVGQRAINARSETAGEKPTFRQAVRKRRCLIVADGFFEWTDPILGLTDRIEQREESRSSGDAQKDLFGESGAPTAKKTKAGKLPRQPWWIGMKDHGPFAFAGMWELNQQTDLGPVESCTILTTTPNELLEPMHDRMPVILPPEKWDMWLDPDLTQIELIESFCVPFSAELMETYPVSPDVNSPRAFGKDFTLPLVR